IGHRPAEDPYPLAGLQIGVRQRRKTGTHYPLDRLDLLPGNHRPLIPSLAEDAHEPPRLSDLDVAVLVQRIVEEEVAGEHRGPDSVPETAASRPDLECGKEGMEGLGDQLVVHDLLIVTPRPQNVPGRARRSVTLGVDIRRAGQEGRLTHRGTALRSGV